MKFYSNEEYEAQVAELILEGICRLDAQAIVDANELRDAREYEAFREFDKQFYDELERDHDEPYEPDAYLDASYEDQYDLGDY